MTYTTTVKLEFTPGVWTDVSNWVDFDAGIAIARGRSTQFDTPSAGRCSFTLDNVDGRFTPLRQTLSDLVTAHPYYPNVRPRIRVWVQVTDGTTTSTRFLGFVKGFPPGYVVGDTAKIAVSATDYWDQLSRVTLQAAISAEVMFDKPLYLWQMNDAAGSTAAVESSGNLGTPSLTVGAAAPTFGSAGPGTDVSTPLGVQFAPGQTLQAVVAPLAGPYTIETWVNFAAYPSNFVSFFAGDTASGEVTLASSSSGVLSSVGGSTGVTIGLNTWHHCVLAVAANLSAIVYLDGVNVSTGTSLALTGHITFGDWSSSAFTALNVNMGYAAIYGTQLSATRVAAHYAAGTGYAGDTTGTRFSRALTLAGLTSAQWSIDTCSALVSPSYPQAGKSIIQIGQDMADTEGGGSVAYVSAAGFIRFTSRRQRDGSTPTLTIPALSDLDGTAWAPEYDESALINTSTVTRNGGLTQTAVNAASVTTYGITSDSFTSYASTDADALLVAQYHVASLGIPGYRLPQATVDLYTGQTAGILAQVDAMEIGKRVRITGVSPLTAPLSTVDGMAEGLAETIATGVFKVTYDLSPADNPARSTWGTFRWGPTAGVSTTALATAAATTVVITTASGPVFTSDATQYPFDIKVGEERITLNGVPGGSTSPQTFTGCTRGANGTVAAVQPAASVVSLAPAYTWSI